MLRVDEPDGQNFKFWQRFPLFLASSKKMKNNITAGFEPTSKSNNGNWILMKTVGTTNQNDHGKRSRRQYVCFDEFISGQWSAKSRNFYCEFSKSATGIRFGIQKWCQTAICNFFTFKFRYQNIVEETHPNTRRKPPFSAPRAAFRALRAFRACIRAHHDLFWKKNNRWTLMLEPKWHKHIHHMSEKSIRLRTNLPGHNYNVRREFGKTSLRSGAVTLSNKSSLMLLKWGRDIVWMNQLLSFDVTFIESLMHKTGWKNNLSISSFREHQKCQQ